MLKEKREEEVVNILKRIVKKRQELGISQFDLALKLNLTNNGYFKVETGKTKLDVRRLLEIAEILKVNPSCFFED
jgi:transcriptional regulator with XRE-family HTH domain